jgi:hypothetical protein
LRLFAAIPAFLRSFLSFGGYPCLCLILVPQG